MTAVRCERCQGKGTVTYEVTGVTITCPVCLSLGTFTPPRRRPPNEYHLVTLHDTLLNWDEVIAMLPLREPKENWDE